MSGWFAVKRGITSHHVFKERPERLVVWLWLLDNAAWKDTKHDVNGKTVTVPRGSVCASERYIARSLGLGYQVVRTALKRFKDEHMINAQVTHGKNLISLCNYEKYQSPEKPINAAPNAGLTQGQRKPNAQKEQGNKGTSKDSNESLAREALCEVASRDVVSEFVLHRKEMRKPVTPRAAKAMANKLRGHPDPDAVLQNSIANGWQGIFPEKVRAPQSHGKDKPSGNDIAERVAARFTEMDSWQDSDPSEPLLSAGHTERRCGGSVGGLDQGVIRLFGGSN